MQRKNFIKIKEDFVCENCGAYVKGNGYTNHCPNCLYSKHVDSAIPGDRESSCKGLMKPINIESKKGEYIIQHKCQKCGHTKWNTASKEDNFESMLSVNNKSNLF